jgi:hypothetical protein
VLLAAPVAAQETSSRSRSSANAQYNIRFIKSGEDQCRVDVLHNTDVAWSLPKCLATVDDLFFISNDGERFWVLKVTPRKPEVSEAPPRKSKRGKQPAPAWSRTVVAELYDREGKLLRTRTIGELVSSARGREEIRQLQHHFLWLEGVSGIPGRAPRVTPDDLVELETAGGKTLRLSFQ